MHKHINDDPGKDHGVDIAEAERFLRLLDPEATKFTFQTFDDNVERGDKNLVRVLHGSLEQHTATLKRLNDKGAGIFVTINRTDLKARKAENIIKITAQFADLDGAPLEPVLKFELKPHIVVASSPERWHIYWLAEGMTLKNFTGIQKNIIKWFNSDRNVHDLPRVMRLPGFFHRKDKDKPFLVHIHSTTQTPPYPAKDIDKAFSKLPNDDAKTAYDQYHQQEEEDWPTGFEPILALLGDGHNLRGFNDVLTRAASSYVATHKDNFNRAELKVILRAAINDAKTKPTRRSAEITRYLSDQYLDDIIKTASQKYNEAAQDRHDAEQEEKLRASYATTGSQSTNDVKPKNRKNEKLPLHIRLAELYLDIMEKRGRDLCVVPDDKGHTHFWKYENGLWSLILDNEVNKWLEPELQIVLNDLDKKGKSSIKIFSETSRHIIRSPTIRRHNSHIEWDAHGKIPTKLGLIDPLTLQIEPMRKEHYCTWRIDLEYDPDAKCPLWQQMLNDAFADRDDDRDRKTTIELVQELTGASLIDNRPKSLRKACILQGNPDSGKTGILEVVSGVLTDKPITTTFAQLNSSHGLQNFIRRAPWVLHEAFNSIGWYLSDLVKKIISGDSIEINPKNANAITLRPKTPPWWGTNYPPAFKDPSGAFAERLLIIPCNVVFDKDKPVGVAATARAVNPGWEPHDLILNTEKAGVFTWALQGLQRALRRGHFVNTEAGKKILDQVKNDSNLVRGFLNDCIEYDAEVMISMPDFLAAISEWWSESHGDGDTKRNPCTPTKVGKDLAALANPRIGQNNAAFKDAIGIRYLIGIKLNKAGRDFWETYNPPAFGSDQHKRTSSSADQTVQSIPDSWLTHPEIIRVKKRAAMDAQKQAKAGS